MKNSYLIICIEFNCNCDCVLCMLRGLRKKLKPVSFEDFKKTISSPEIYKKHNSLILSGAEVTISKDLEKFVKYAKGLGLYKHIQIQTNGRLLSDIKFCKHLKKMGVDEFFISIFGSNSETHDKLTKVKDSFRETLRGIQNLNKLGARIITNTVIVRDNYFMLPQMIELVASFKNVKEMVFWNYWPMDFTDKFDLIERNLNIRPYLEQSIVGCRKNNIKSAIKYFPECMLGSYWKYLDNSQPDIIIDEMYWGEFLKNGHNCLFKNICGAGRCTGLTTAYVKKFGWEENVLEPVKFARKKQNGNVC